MNRLLERIAGEEPRKDDLRQERADSMALAPQKAANAGWITGPGSSMRFPPDR